MSIIDELETRGLLQDFSQKDLLLQQIKPGAKFYFGIDPTASSLTVGHLLGLKVCMHLGMAGLTPIILFGGATGAIGDPSGKKSERQLLAREDIVNNVAAISSQVREIFKRQSISCEFVDNYQWTAKLDVLSFLRDVGKHFSINYMLQKETVRTRVDGSGLSFTEFSYMLLQAHDFWHLKVHNACDIQIGGSDQWGNITAGLELIRRKAAGSASAFSYPLLLDSQGKKFGKSEQGALWLNPELTSPFTMHQYFLNCEDNDVERYLKTLTFLSLDQIADLKAKSAQAPEQRIGQRALADAVCTLAHGASATEEAKQCAQVLFGGSIGNLPDSRLLEIFSGVPSAELSKSDLIQIDLPSLFVKAGLLKSKGEAKRLIESGGAYLNNERISTANELVGEERLKQRSVLVLRSGKKNYALIKAI